LEAFLNSGSLEIARICFVLGILAVNTITDLKYRTVFGSDKLYVVLGAVGFVLFLIDSYNDILESMFWLVVNVTFVLLMWRFKAMASGDIVIMLVFSTTLPIIEGWVVAPLASSVIAMILILAFSLLYNFSLNLHTLYKGQSLFSQYKASVFKKIFSIGLVHQRRNWERHCISVEKGDGFSILTSPIGKKFSTKMELVTPAVPCIPFLFVTFLIILAAISL